MGSKGGNSTSTVQIPADVLARYNSVNANAQNAAAKPFQEYGGQFVAPLNATQNAGIANTNNSAHIAQPYYGAATGAASGSAYNVNPGALNVNQYLSPYLQNVGSSTAALLNQNNQQAQSGQMGTAIRSGAFGGDRSGIAAANLNQEQNLANANIYSNIFNTGYSNALGAAQQQQGVQLGADVGNRANLQNVAGLYANLGSAAQTAGLQGASAQMTAGQAQQQTAQAQNTAVYNQFLQKQAYPFQTAQFLANIAEGTGTNSGSTTTTNTTGNGLFSDKRLKMDVRPVGKTFDGQKIYTYKYKGHPETYMGLMAQEVERHTPNAVGLAAGYKTVDYDKATDKSAKRGHFAFGGTPYDPLADESQMLANYNSMYAPLLTKHAGLIPVSTGNMSSLHPANASPVQQQNVFQNADTTAKSLQSLYITGKGLAKQLKGKPSASTMDSRARGLASDQSMVEPLSVSSAGTGDVKELSSPDLSNDEVSISDNTGDSTSESAHDDPSRGYATGGIPDSNLDSLDIPDDQTHDSLKPAPPVTPPTDAPLKDIAQMAAAASKAASGGRMMRADGGATSASELHIPDDETQDSLDPASPVEPPSDNPLAQASNGASGGRMMRADGGATSAPENAILHALRLARDPYAQFQKMQENDNSSDDNSTDGHASSNDNGDANATATDYDSSGLMPDVSPIDMQSLVAQSPLDSVSSGLSNVVPRKGGHLDSSIVSYLQQKGLPAGLARGIAAGIYAESGNNSGAKNPSSGAMGIGQWLGPRLTALQNRYGSNPSKQNQLDFLLDELNGGDRGGKSVLGASNENDVLNAYVTKFMRPKAGAETTGDIARGLGALRAGFARGGYADGGVGEDGYDFSNPYGDTVNSDTSNIMPDSPMARSGNPSTPTDLLPPDAGFDRDAAASYDAGHDQPESTSGLGAATSKGSSGHGYFHDLFHSTPNSDAHTNAVLSALTGLASFATAPTRNPIYAIASGVGAGAKQYQDLRQFKLEQQQTDINRMGANANLMRAGLSAADRFMYLGPNQWRNSIDGSILTDEEHKAALNNVLPVAVPYVGSGLGAPAGSSTSQPNATLPTDASGKNTSPATSTAVPMLKPHTLTDTLYANIDKSPQVAPYLAAREDHLAKASKFQAMANSPEYMGMPIASVYAQRAEQEKALASYNNEIYTKNRAALASPQVGQIDAAQQGLIQQNIAVKNSAYADYNDAFQSSQDLAAIRASLVDKYGKPMINGGPLGGDISHFAQVAQQFGIPSNVIQSLTGTNPNSAATAQALAASVGSQLARANLPGSPIRQAEFTRFVKSVNPEAMPSAAMIYLIDKVMIPQNKNRMYVYNAVANGDIINDNLQKKQADFLAKHPWYITKSGPDAMPTSPPSAPTVSPPNSGMIVSASGKRYRKP